jgi:C1A family cysteine protease
MNRFLPRGLGWRPDVPDFRDFSPDHVTVREHFVRLNERHRASDETENVDLREFFVRDPPNQANVNASSAFACSAIVEYFEYRALGRFIEPSAYFLSQAAARLQSGGCTSCCGLRNTLKAMVRLGMPSEDQWSDFASGASEPTDPVLFAFSDYYRSICYLRLDQPSSSGADALRDIKAFLRAGFPVAFGFAVPDSLTYDADIAFRPTFDSVRGGQAAVAVGYDDNRMTAAKGAVLLRCSWGTEWGEHGYGWLPYVFLEKRLALDFWTLIKPDWLASGEFNRPTSLSHLPPTAQPQPI